MFRPGVESTLVIDGVTYAFTQHPGVKAIRTPYALGGRKATVYQLRRNVQKLDNVANERTVPNLYAFKVFKESFRTPHIAHGAQQLAQFAFLPGLQVCARRVLTRENHAELIAQHPELEYSVLMSWIAGDTWHDIVASKQAIAAQQSDLVAKGLISILAAMEARGIAHCDVSGPNVMVNLQVGDQPAEEHGTLTLTSTVPSALTASLALVDVEDLYAVGLPRPEKAPAGTPGYAHRTASRGLWEPTADRFAAAIMLGEMLGWCDQDVRQHAYGEHYFEQLELQTAAITTNKRVQVLLKVLRARWGVAVAEAFLRAWHSRTLDECPTLAEWAGLLHVDSQIKDSQPSAEKQGESAEQIFVQAVMEKANVLTQLGRIEEAITELRGAYELIPDMVAEVYAQTLLAQAKVEEHSGNMQRAMYYYRTASAVAPASLPVYGESVIASAPLQAASPVAPCPACGYEVQPDWVRCPQCNLDLSIVSSNNREPKVAHTHEAPAEVGDRELAEHEGGAASSVSSANNKMALSAYPTTTAVDMPVAQEPPQELISAEVSQPEAIRSATAPQGEENQQLQPPAGAASRCPGCGGQVQPDWLRCPYCASELPARRITADSTAHKGEEGPAYVAQVPQPNRFRLRWLWVAIPTVVIIILITCGLIGFAVQSYLRSTQAVAAARVATATSIAIRTSTAQAHAASVATQIIVRSTAEARQLKLLYGPTSGKLTHEQTEKIPLHATGVNTLNFIVGAKFYNPYDAAEHLWDWGFIFRSTAAGDEYRLSIESSKTWTLDLVHNAFGAPNVKNVARGRIDDLDVSPSGVNTTDLVAVEGSGFFFVNGKQIAQLNLSEHLTRGDVQIATGVHSGYQLAGKTTAYDRFSVWLPQSYELGGGLLAHSKEQVGSKSANINLSNFIAEARFYNPFSTQEHAWDYGFTFRRTSTEEYRLVVSSDKSWSLLLATNANGTWQYNTLHSGTVMNLDTSPTRSNEVRLTVIGKTVILVVNDILITSIDSAQNMVGGDVLISTAFIDATTFTGKMTKFEAFRVWPVELVSTIP